ncbi:hypothetical protein IM792_07210 [Mucilaginibacter sp. JRF]|uniref:hypothetical protein n=1 Tax=Mucilaginibacter sp. JRF TaxID=2780088 RepID=UPI0018818ACF|nr:hypothetical protein [Mucilaginibacter sp. JRF]MBE9584229.1 hypothetical protein [Mucilaginibacter sp. JRF]
MPLPTTYFRFRSRFNFSPHRFEIGNPIIQNKALADNFFLKKIYELDSDEYKDYYDFHFRYFQQKEVGEEEAFFNHVTGIVTDRMHHYRKQNPFSSAYPERMASAKKLEAFLTFLKTVDRWHRLEPIESVVAEKEREIDRLNERISVLETQLKEATKYDPGEKVVISKSHLPVFISLMLDLQELTLPNSNKLTRSQTQAPWYKMIARYFMHGDKPISIDTARNYFPAQKDDPPAKFIGIPDKDKLFTIVPTGKA